MSEEQLSAFLAKLKDDVELQKKLKGAADLDAVLAIAKEYGFDISKAALLRHEAKMTLELTNEELESISGGSAFLVNLANFAKSLKLDLGCFGLKT